MKDKYRATTGLTAALGLWSEALKAEGVLRKTAVETLPVGEKTLGRITSGPVFALESSPGWHSSAMDGFAVLSMNTFGASESAPKKLKIGAEAVPIDTGKPMPEGMDAVIMHEEAFAEGGFIEVSSPVPPWKNVRVAGEDIVATELIVPEGHRLRPVDLSALLAGGLLHVDVRKRPRVSIIPTGSDLVEPGRSLRRGDIIESNSAMLAGMISEWGGLPERRPIAPDEPAALAAAIEDALQSGPEMLVINAGASLGTRDFTFQCVERLGRVVVHGISIKPGKPAVLGFIKGTPVIGTPGFPVAAYTVFELFAKPVVHAMQGTLPEPVPEIEGKLSRSVASTLGQEEFIRVNVGKVAGNFIVTPLARGSGQLMSLVRADGVMRIPPMSEGPGAGSPVKVQLLRDARSIENTVVIIGSHDSAIDVLSSFLKRSYPGYSISSAHVGSMGGLVALKKNEAHAAPTHLLDEDTGEYNVPFIKKMLTGMKITLLNLLYREQGLIVLKGNPKGIKNFSDLARDNVRFINRQGGSGTRLLLDKHLRELGIDAKLVRGYEKEEYTHMAVASAVLTGVADAGLGVLSAARALGLDFVPVTRERYDLAIPEEYMGLPMMKAMLEVIRTDAGFRDALNEMGGYGLEDMGKVIWRGV
jgi:putative molybdopterin biosynthesis protein